MVKKAKKLASSAKKTVKKARKLKPIKRSRQKPRRSEVVMPPVVDVTSQVQESVVEVKPEQADSETPGEPAQTDAEFQQGLKQEPKKGFFARLFGKK